MANFEFEDAEGGYSFGHGEGDEQTIKPVEVSIGPPEDRVTDDIAPMDAAPAEEPAGSPDDDFRGRIGFEPILIDPAPSSLLAEDDITPASLPFIDISGSATTDLGKSSDALKEFADRLGHAPRAPEPIRFPYKGPENRLELAYEFTSAASGGIYDIPDSSQPDGQPAMREAEQFTAEDMATADRAWGTYMDELKTGGGLRWDFGQLPDAIFDAFDGKYNAAHAHARDLEAFVDRVQALGELVNAMTRLQNRPIASLYPLGRHGGTVTAVITATDVAAYARFHSAVVDYTGALIKYGPNSPTVAKAAANVAQLINPNDWRAAGYDIPADVQPLERHNPRWYLESLRQQHL